MTVMRSLRAWLFACLALTTAATTAAPLAIADALKLSPYLSLRLAPDGRHLLAIAAAGHSYAVVLIDSTTLEQKILFGPVVVGVLRSARWIAPDLVVVDTAAGVFIVTLDGTVSDSVGAVVVSAIPGAEPGKEAILVLSRRAEFERVEVRTKTVKELAFDIPARAYNWIFDEAGEPRVVTTRDTAFWTDDTTVTYLYRERGTRTWVELASFPFLAIDWTPVAVLPDRHSLVVSSRSGRDTRAYFRYDLGERRVAEMMVGHPSEDIAAVGSNDDTEARWVVTDGLKTTIHWFDPHGIALQRAVDAALPGRVNMLSDEHDGKALVSSYGDVDPGRWFLLDTAGGSLRQVAQRNDRIDPDAMSPTRLVRYRSLDGLEIPAYLTLPASGSTDLPAIVLVHGGPVARDHWQFDPEVQMLASRGYAVLQPQFRGSSGFGERFEKAGFGEWGRAMQDDVTAGAQWLVAQGFANPRRMCIVGASYGGYAAMWAMAKTPDLFRCGVSLAGVTDLSYMMKDASDVNSRPEGRLFRRANVGDADRQEQQFSDVSPVRHAALFQAPVLIAHGNKDVRVPIEHSRLLVSALRQYGKSVEWIELPGSGHDLANPANQVRFFDALFAFLARYTAPESVAAPTTVETKAAEPLANGESGAR